MNSQKDVLIVLINYNNNFEIIQYVDQVLAIKNNNPIRVVVVNNKFSETTDNSLKTNLLKYDFVDFIEANENLGYMNGFLFGLDYFYNRYHYLPYWTILSNSDILFKQEDFFNILLQKEYDKDVWCIGPSVQDLQNHYCNPHYKERISLKKINRIRFFMKNSFLCKLYFSLSHKKHSKEKKETKPNSCWVYSVHGCFVILRNDFYFSLNGERYGVLLYSEESFIAEILREKSKKSYYDSDIEVVHTENVATGKLGAAKRGKRIYESLTYIKDRFYG